MTRDCVTHHHACDCRETEFSAIKAERDALRQRIESARMTTVRAGINDEATIYQEELPPNWIGKRVRLVVDEG